MTVTTDDTARILAEYGTPVKRAEYAIMGAQRVKREAREALMTRQDDAESIRAAVLAIMRAHHDTLHAILATFDAERGPDDFDTRLTADARYCVYGTRDGRGNDLPRCARCHGRAIIGRNFPAGIGESCTCCGHWWFI